MAGREAAATLRLAWPLTVTSLTSFAPRLSLLVAVGHLPDGARLLGAAGLASMYCSFAMLMPIRSSTFGAAPLLAQAWGAASHARVGHLLLRVLALHAALALCLSLPLAFLALPLLTAAGTPAALAADAQRFVWLRLAGLPGVVLTIDCSMFLAAQRLVRLPMAVSLVGNLAQVGLTFALTASLGFVGAPLAMTAGELLQGGALALLSPWLLRRHGHASWPAWRERRQAVRGWGEICAKGAPAAAMVMAEWLGWEVSLFVAGGLCDAASPTCAVLEAIPVCTTLLVCQFLLVFGIPLAASNRVGNLLGAGDGEGAARCARVALGMTAASAATLGLLAVGGRRRLLALFVDDEPILAAARRLMPLTALYAALASLAPGWSQQMLFGVGAPLRLPALLNVIAFFGVGLPGGALLAYDAGLGAEGLWCGLVLAMVLIIVGQYSYLWVAVDWAHAARVARERALGESGGVAGEMKAAENDRVALATADGARQTVEMGEDLFAQREG
ncbi:hypothetical protein AB1Y20_008270 [Prymnesium parvum]|uniref:Protein DETOXIFICATION n=1 Tax=Prymnesium parvum TaxID=97485 RepID=A0AB34ITQ5_PRYPA